MDEVISLLVAPPTYTPPPKYAVFWVMVPPYMLKVPPPSVHMPPPLLWALFSAMRPSCMLKLPPMLTYTPPPSLPIPSSVLFLVMEPPYMLKVPLATYTPPPLLAVFWVMAPPYMLKVALAPTYTAPPYRSGLVVPPSPPVMLPLLPLPAQSCRAREASGPALPLMVMLCPFKFIVCPLRQSVTSLLIKISAHTSTSPVRTYFFPPSSELTFPLSFVQPVWSPVQFCSAAIAVTGSRDSTIHITSSRLSPFLPLFFVPFVLTCNPPCFSENSRIFPAASRQPSCVRKSCLFSVLRPEVRPILPRGSPAGEGICRILFGKAP